MNKQLLLGLLLALSIISMHTHAQDNTSGAPETMGPLQKIVTSVHNKYDQELTITWLHGICFGISLFSFAQGVATKDYRFYLLGAGGLFGMGAIGLLTPTTDNEQIRQQHLLHTQKIDAQLLAANRIIQQFSAEDPRFRRAWEKEKNNALSALETKTNDA